jgi:hypothetical protein
MNAILESNAVDYFEFAGYIIVFVAAISVLRRKGFVRQRNDLEIIYRKAVSRWADPFRLRLQTRVVILAAINLVASTLGMTAFLVNWQQVFHLGWVIMGVGGAFFVGGTLSGGPFESWKERDPIEHDMSFGS